MKGLSRVTGNCPARFLGEEATVTSLPYPTPPKFPNGIELFDKQKHPCILAGVVMNCLPEVE